MLYFYPEKHTLDATAGASISDAQEARVTDMFAFINSALEGQSFLVGNDLTVCDFYLFMLSHWASEFKRPPLSFNHLGRYLRTLAQRDSIKRVCEVEGTCLDAYRES